MSLTTALSMLLALAFGWRNVVDLLLVGLLAWRVYAVLRAGAALRVFFGMVALAVVYFVVRATGLPVLTTVLGQFVKVGVLAAVVVFQPEIRRFLHVLGRSSSPFEQEGLFAFAWRRGAATPEGRAGIAPFVEAARTLSGSRTGALIVFAKSADLKFYADSGDILDALPSKRLLLALFNKTSPLHDGAVLIEAGRVRAARCILPVTERADVPAALGLRHRAAIGLSEATDAVVVVVSEETGQISLVHDGQIHRNLTAPELRALLVRYVLDAAPSGRILAPSAEPPGNR